MELQQAPEEGGRPKHRGRDHVLNELVKTAIEVHGKLVEMGETVETPVMFKQDNHAVIKMSEMITAHAGSKRGSRRSHQVRAGVFG